MDISIIIVSWNTRELLKKCLASIYANTQGASFEIFVVDNGSRDGTVEMARREFTNVTVIANEANRGFADANNQGIKRALGRYILLLNPDTELKSDALSRMAEWMDTKPSCGIAGCHLLNADLSHQNSVRRFPGVSDQTIILLKLHHLFPRIPPIQSYLADDFDYEKESPVDQVMGAFFMIRREVIKKIGTLDERNFFNWFEEVDFCRRAREAGYEIWYTPVAEIIHHYGQSFKQVMQFAKQRMWNRSLRRYFRKHHSVIAYCVISFASWIALGLAWNMDLAKKVINNMFHHRLFLKTLLIIALINFLSFFAFSSRIVNWLSFILILACAALVAWRNLLWGVYILLVELMISSQGHLFDLYLNDFRVSLRMGLFTMLLVVWALKQISNVKFQIKSKCQISNFKTAIRDYRFYILWGILIAWGIANALLKNNNRAFLYQDANGYLFFLLLPVFITAFANQKKITSYLITIWFAALVWQFIIATLLLFSYGHIDVFWRMLVPLYDWFRDQRIIEVGLYKYNFYRVFMQSEIWALTGFFVFLSHLFFSLKIKKSKLKIWTLLTCIITILLISLSRSLWVSGVVGLIWFAYLYLTRFRPPIQKIMRHALTLASSVVTSVAIIAALLIIPIGKIPGLKALASIPERATETEETAIRSRKSLLPSLKEGIRDHALLGAGFGATVTYKTTDPRYLAAHPDNPYYTTFAFEWGWLDVWYKLGIVGLIVYLALIFDIVKRGWRLSKYTDASNKPLMLGLASGLIALVVVHFFTPFLNHPLGIGYLLLADAIFRGFKKLL